MTKECRVRRFFADGNEKEDSDVLAKENSGLMAHEFDLGFRFCNDQEKAHSANPGKRYNPEELSRRITNCMEEFLDFSDNSKKTGALHLAALFDGEKFSFFAEDVSRHNAIYKAIGACLESNETPDKYILFTSGRITLSVLVLADSAGIRTIVSKGAVSFEAAEKAKEEGMDIYGFASDKRVNYYG